MWSRWTFLAVSLSAIALTSQVSAQNQQGYPPPGYQPYPQGQPMQQQPMPQHQPMPQQQMPQQQMPPQGYYPQQQPAPDGQGGFGYPQQQGYDPNVGYPGNAAPPEPLVSSVDGAIQIGAGISLLSFGSTSMSPSTTPPPAMVGAMPAPDMFVTTCCAVKNPLLVEAGYGLSDRLLLGAQLQFVSASESTKSPLQDLKTFGFSFGPKLDYHFSPTSRWNPFVGAVVNLTLTNKSLYGTKDSRTIFGVLARAGMRYFVLDQLSIDPILELGGHFGSGTQSLLAAPEVKTDYSLSGFQFAVSLGLSLWVK